MFHLGSINLFATFFYKNYTYFKVSYFIIERSEVLLDSMTMGGNFQGRQEQGKNKETGKKFCFLQQKRIILY